MFLHLAFHRFFIVVFRFPDTLAFHDDLGLQPRSQKSLQREAVILKKARSGHGGSADNAHPAHRFPVQHSAQTEIQRHSNAHRQNGTYKLPHGQSKKERFAVGSNFLVDFDFHNQSPKKEKQVAMGYLLFLSI